MAESLSSVPPTRLVGRSAERLALDELLESVARELSRALVLLGEPGIGKSALLDDLADRAGGRMRVLRVTGVPAEMELAFAGLHQLLGTAVEFVDRLPGPQRAALRGILGLDDGGVGNRLVIAAGVLGLLVEVSARGPLLCLVDDAQWLDPESAQALSFVARRLTAEPIGIVFASREGVEPLRGLPTRTLRGLPTREARTLLDRALVAPIDDAVRRQIVTETRGNPLALLELPRGITPAELAGGFALPGITPLSEQIEASFRRRLDELPPTSRQILLLAAAEPVGDPTVLWSASAQLGLGDDAVVPAVASGLLHVGMRVRFCHPLARSAVYRAADHDARRRVHRALEAVTDPGRDPDRRAWHRAQAAAGPDEHTAAALERSAERARARGGVAAVAAFLERAAAVTPAPAKRTRRLIAAAAATRDAGSLDHALELLDLAEVEPLSAQQTARVARARGHIALERRQPHDAVRLLGEAARSLERRDVCSARAAALEALVAAIWSVSRPEDVALVQDAASIVDAAALDVAGSVTDQILDGLRTRIVEGHAAAVPKLRRALDGLVADTAGQEARSATLATYRAMLILPIELWDDEAWALLVDRQAEAAGRAGALAVQATATSFVAVNRIVRGDIEAARLALEQGRSIAQATGGPSNDQTRVLMTAWMGDEAETHGLVRELRHRHPTGLDIILCDYAEAVLGNALGRFDTARRAASRVVAADHIGMGTLAMVELADAASRAGATAELADAAEQVTERAGTTRTPWALGVADRFRALLAEGDEARAHYESSIEHLGRTGLRSELARSHLLYGEWLRRHGGRGEAREQLVRAREMFRRMGAQGFADRATRELRAAGDPETRIAAPGRLELTAQERQVATLAADGLTNPEIAARLFLSARTVQYHLRKVFTKLEIRSRVQLRAALRRERA